MNETEAETPGAGRWQVTTETSVYLLDLDAKRITRLPDAGAGAGQDYPQRQSHRCVAIMSQSRCWT
jgi:hypothetical protein